MHTIIGIILLFLLSIACTKLFHLYALKAQLLDHPNHRSSHTQATPRGGGLVFAILWLLTSVVLLFLHQLPTAARYYFVLAPLLILAIGFWDDHQQLPAKLRFAVQLAASMLMLFPLTQLLGQPLAWTYHFGLLVILLLTSVWSTNLFNFMDGTDGYAATEALFIFTVGGFLLWHVNATSLAKLAWALSAVVGGFLIWNKPKALLFMGDVGSSFLGFMILPFALLGQLHYQLSIVLWFMLYLGFSFDATLTLLRRILHGEKWYQAHKSHAYQRLHQAGHTHRAVLNALIILNSVLTLLTLLALYKPACLWPCLLAALLASSSHYLWVERKYPMHKNKEVAHEI